MVWVQPHHSLQWGRWALYERMLGLPRSSTKNGDAGDINPVNSSSVLSDEDLLDDFPEWFELQKMDSSRVYKIILEEIQAVQQKVKELNDASEYLSREMYCRQDQEEEQYDHKIQTEVSKPAGIIVSVTPDSDHNDENNNEDHNDYDGDAIDDDDDETDDIDDDKERLEIPCNILGSMVAPYLSHRPTFNSLSQTCKEVHMMCHELVDPLPPWPETILRADGCHSLWSVSFSPDHMMLAAGANDGSIRLWHRRFGVQDEISRAHMGRIYSLVFDAQSRYMASGSGDGEVKLWNYAEAMVTIHRRRRRRQQQQQQQQEQQQQRQQLQQQQQQQQQQIDDGDNLRTSNNGTPDNNIQHDDNDDDDDEIWRGISMEVSHASHPHTHVDCLAFNSTGETLASSGDGTIRLWDVHTRSCIAALREDDIHVVESISFSPDGKTLAAGNWGNKISLWDVDSHHIVGSAAESTCVHSVCFSPSQPQHLTRTNVCEYQLCSATDHRDLRLWKISDDHLTTDLDNTARQQQQRQQQRQYMTSHTSLVGHVDTVWSVVFSSNGLLIASGSGDGTCRVWNSSTGRCLRVLNQQHDDDVNVMPNSVYCVSFSPCNGYVAAARDDGSIEIGRCC